MKFRIILVAVVFIVSILSVGAYTSWSGYNGSSVWSNATIPGGTLEINMSVNTTDNVTDIRIWTDDLDTNIKASNIKLYVSSDNLSFGLIGTYTDGGSNLTVNSTNWNAGTMGSNPFTYGGITNVVKSIYCRFLLTIPEAASAGSYGQNDWAVHVGNTP